LKKHGHQTSLIHVTDELGYSLDLSRIAADVQAYDPGLVCFSSVTNQWFYVKQIAKAIRRVSQVPIVVGGHHANAAPMQIIQEKAVNFVCKGEGEVPLLQLVEHLEKGLPVSDVRNLVWKKAEGEVVVNPVGRWIDDLDQLPFEDREIFRFQDIVETRHGWAEVITTRGCPYECTYCFNLPFFQMYRDDLQKSDSDKLYMRDFLRRRSVEHSIRLLQEVKEQYPNVKYFTFVDDIFGLQGRWLTDFCNAYPEKVGIPFACTSQPRSFNRSVAQLLSHAGCKVLKMGVESGNEQLRQHVLKRNITDEMLVRDFELAREYGLKPQAFNMIGLPTETREQVLETVRLNARMRPYIVWMSTFMPYPGTHLYDFCVQNDLMDETKWDEVNSYRGGSVLKDTHLPAAELKKLRVMFKWHLNASLGNGVSEGHQKHIDELSALGDSAWQDDSIEDLYRERDQDLDERYRNEGKDHYITRKYVNMYWGKEYGYDLS
jgi:radical SAM superfamily enzyme YgiQ (UPF0313 family)